MTSGTAGCCRAEDAGPLGLYLGDSLVMWVGGSPCVKALCFPGQLDQTLPVGSGFQSWTALVSTSSRDGAWEGVGVGGGELASRVSCSACLLPAHTHRDNKSTNT